MGRGVAWREEMMGIIFGWERWECWSWGLEKQTRNGGQWMEWGEAEWGVESWKFKSSRNF
jgi:hypothetical protein